MVVLSAMLVLARIALFDWQTLKFSPDSWAYYELAKSLREGDYALNHLRSFQAAGRYSAAFPPGFPALWALVDIISGAGARSGLVINLFVMAAIGWLCERLTRQMTGLRWAGLALAVLLFQFPGFYDEIVAGRSIPLTVALILAAFALIVGREAPRPAHAALAGIAIGLTLLLRFDMLPFALCILAWIVLAFASRRNAVALAFATGLLAVWLPWIALSLKLYGRPFASDSSWVAMTADASAFVTDWYPAGALPLTAREAPALFMGKVWGNLMQLPGALIGAPGAIVFALVLFLLAVHVLARKQLYSTPRLPTLWAARAAPPLAAAAFTLAALSLIPANVLTGYLDTRYFSFLWLCLLGWLVLPALRLSTVRAPVLWGLALASLGNGAIGLFLARLQLGAMADAELTASPVATPRQIAACQKLLPANRNRALVLDDTRAAALAAEQGLKTSMVPMNFRQDRLAWRDKVAFLDSYGIGLIVDSPLTQAPDIMPAEWLQPAPSVCGPQTYVRRQKPRP